MTKIYRKLTMLLTITILLFSSPITSYCAVEKVELLHNGNFEQGNTNGWQVFNGVMTITEEKAKEGKYALSLKSLPGKANMFMVQQIVVNENANYELSLFLKGTSDDGTYPAVKLQFYDSDNKIANLNDIQYEFADYKIGRWRKESIKFSVPKNMASVEILIRVYGSQTVFVDGISLLGEKGVPPKNGEKIPLENLPSPVNGTDNLVLNGNFEEFDETTGGPKNWTVFKGNWQKNPYVSVDNEYIQDGNNAIKIDTSSRGNPWISQHIKNIKPYAEYCLTAWVNAYAIKGDGAAIKLEFYRGDEVKAEDNVANVTTDYKKSTDGAWIQISYTFKAPQNCHSIAIYPRLYANGIVFFDNISLFEIQKPPMILLSTDNVFYYSDKEKGLATAKPNNEIFSNLSDCLVDFKLKDGDKILVDNKNNKLDKNVEFEFDLSLMTQKKHEYTIEATLKDKSNVEIQTLYESIYKYDRPTALDKNGVYIKDNKRFDPILAYHVPLTHYPACRDVGINVVQSGSYRTAEEYIRVLDEAKKNNLMVLVALYSEMKPAGHPDNIENNREILKKIKDHPSVFAYAVMDEPAYNIMEYDKLLKDSYIMIHDIDTYHPIYMVECLREHFNQVAKYTDIFAIDPYPEAKYPKGRYVTDELKLAQKAVNYEKPIYAILQTFTFGNYFPYINDIRHMAYESFIQGAKGIGYFCIEDSYGFMVASSQIDLNETIVWEGLKKTHTDEYPDAFNHFVNKDYPIFNDGETQNLIWHSFVKNNDIYMIILNRTETAMNIELPLISNNKKVKIDKYKAEAIAGGNVPPFNGEKGVLNTIITPLEAVVYKISPEVEIPIENLSGDIAY